MEDVRISQANFRCAYDWEGLEKLGYFQLVRERERECPDSLVQEKTRWSFVCPGLLMRVCLCLAKDNPISYWFNMRDWMTGTQYSTSQPFCPRVHVPTVLQSSLTLFQHIAPVLQAPFPNRFCSELSVPSPRTTTFHHHLPKVFLVFPTPLPCLAHFVLQQPLNKIAVAVCLVNSPCLFPSLPQWLYLMTRFSSIRSHLSTMGAVICWNVPINLIQIGPYSNEQREMAWILPNRQEIESLGVCTCEHLVKSDLVMKVSFMWSSVNSITYCLV